MNNKNVLDLIVELQSKEFWGSLKIIFKQGKPVHMEIEQTVKNDGCHSIFISQKTTRVIREA